MMGNLPRITRTLRVLAAALAPLAHAQDNTPENLLPNGDFRGGMGAVELWDPRPDVPGYAEAILPRTVESDHPGGGNALFFPAFGALQNAAMTQGNLLLFTGYNFELAVTYKSPDPNLDAYAEVVLNWATWPNIAKLDLPPSAEWQTVSIPFKGTINARNLTVQVRNLGAGELFVNEIIVRQMPHDPGQLPALREVKEHETPTWTTDGTWPFNRAADPHTDDALFTLRPLLDTVAGERGWIKVDANGDFTRGDGSPIRFWGAGEGVPWMNTAEDDYARDLAKRGVNMIRHHGRLNLANVNAETFHKPSDQEIDVIQKTVAVFKRHGIYSTVSGYYPNAWGIAYEEGFSPYEFHSAGISGLIFYEPKLQDAFKSWWRECLTRPNPHCPDRTPMKDDPAFAILQIQNEDSLFWWEQWGLMWNRAMRPQYLALNTLFQKWLDDNGITLELDEAARDWFFRESECDFPPESKLDFRFWVCGDKTRPPPESFRLSMRFAAELERNFYADFETFIRDEIGCPVVINAGNWQTGDQVSLLDHLRWAYDANEVIGCNRYINLAQHVFGGDVIVPGDMYTSASCVAGDNWRALSTNLKQVKGRAMILPESNWTAPGLYQSEGPLLATAYQSLTGVDIFYWFMLNRNSIFGVPADGNRMHKWSEPCSPCVMGGFPAAAWMFHKGLIQRGAVAVDEKRALAGDMWELKTPIIAEDGNFDPNVPGTIRSTVDIAGGAPYGSFLIGPVEIEYDKDPSGTKIDSNGQDPADLARGVIRSNTGEIFMNAPKGMFLLDAPQAQGATGFFKQNGAVATGALEINLDNHYATVMAVSLDDKPLSESGKVLLQVTTVSRPAGWAETPQTYDAGNLKVDGFRVDSVGAASWNVQSARGTIAIQNAGLSKATKADPNFYAAGSVPVERRGGSLVVTFPEDALYVLLE